MRISHPKPTATGGVSKKEKGEDKTRMMGL